MTTRKPAQVFPPGEFIAEELEARGWTQEDLAKILDKPLPTVNKLIQGKTAIIPETANKLAAAFGTSAELWMNLESAWQLSQTESEAEIEGVRERAKIYDLAPVREMIRRGWIKKSATPDQLAQELIGHFGVTSLDQYPNLRAAARAATSGESDEFTPAQLAWFCRCRNVAALVDAQQYRKSALESAIVELRRFVEFPEEIRHVPRVLAEAGVRIVVVEHLQHTKIDGGALRRDPIKPVVALSLRFGRIDNFWFTLFHELAHILYEDGQRTDSEICKAGANMEAAEARANQAAASWLIASEKLTSFIQRHGPLYSTAKVERFAKVVGVHPGIVVGQLKFRGEMPWENLNRLQIDVRDIVRQSNICDGWGQLAPTK